MVFFVFTAGGTVADLFSAKQRGLGMAIFAAAPFLGPAVGPIVRPVYTPPSRVSLTTSSVRWFPRRNWRLALGRCPDRPLLRPLDRYRRPFLPRDVPRRPASTSCRTSQQGHRPNVHLQGGQGEGYPDQGAVQAGFEQALAVVVQGADRVLVIALVSILLRVFTFHD